MPDSQLRTVIIIDDDHDYRKLLKTLIGQLLPQLRVHEYDPIAKGAPKGDFNWADYDVLVLDYHLSLNNVTGLDILREHHQKSDFPATIMLTGTDNEEVAINALQFDIYAYLRKESLTKDKLKQSIIESWEANKTERKKQKEATEYNQAFSKELFYQKLEQPKGPDGLGPDRALLVIQLNDVDTLEKQIGLIARDDLVKQIAKNSFDVFQAGACNPNITCIGEATIALQIDAPATNTLLEFNLQGLCDHLQKRKFTLADRVYKYTVSIGALLLDGTYTNATEILSIASEASELAARGDDNSYHIWQGSEMPTPAEDAEAETKPESPAALETKLEEPVKAVQQAMETLREQERVAKATKLKLKKQIEAAEEAEAGKPEAIESMIKKALAEQRCVQLYQPIITMFVDDNNEQPDMFAVSLQILDENGVATNMDNVDIHKCSIGLQQSMDQWTLRQIIRGIIQSKQANNSYIFMFSVSEAWFSDITLFNWLQKMLSEYTEFQPGNSIILTINAQTFIKNKKRAMPLVTSLYKNYGFKIALDGMTDFDEIDGLIKATHSSLLLVSLDNIGLLNETTDAQTGTDGGGNDNDDEAMETPSLLDTLKDRKIKFITKNINDSLSLTKAIGFGTDYAFGDFIGEHQNAIGNITNVESFELT